MEGENAANMKETEIDIRQVNEANLDTRRKLIVLLLLLFSFSYHDCSYLHSLTHVQPI